MDPRPDRYRSLFAYEKDVHELVLDSFETVPETKRTAEYGVALDLVAHLARARHLWLHRMGILKSGPKGLFPRNTELDGVRQELAAIQAQWDEYFETLDAAELDREITYRAMEGDAYKNRVEDIVTQLFGHSWYHRGQVAQIVRRLGGQPAVTDYIYGTRVAVAD